MLVAIFVLSKSTSSMIFNRLDIIKEHYYKIRRGERGYHDLLPHNNQDEIDELISNLNSMSEAIGDYEKKLLEERNNLEKRVQEQTKELKEKNDELEKYNKVAVDQFEKARQIHRQLFPPDFIKIKGLDLDAYYEPAERLGGDFYYVEKISESKVLFYVSDVAGHGLDGAMLNILVRESVNQYLSMNNIESFSPSEVLKFVHSRFVEEDFPVDYFICLLIGVIDLGEDNVCMANAGIHIPPLVLEQAGEIREVDVKGVPISKVIDSDMLYFNEKIIDFSKDSMLFITTDGLIEETVGEEQFGMEKVKHVVNQNRNKKAKELSFELTTHLKAFMGGKSNNDDITFLIIKKI